MVCCVPGERDDVRDLVWFGVRVSDSEAFNAFLALSGERCTSASVSIPSLMFQPSISEGNPLSATELTDRPVRFLLLHLDPLHLPVSDVSSHCTR